MRIATAVGVSALALLSGTAQATSPGSTDALRLTTKKTGASTGVYASEIFNARYKNGQLKPLRHSLIGFPKGTKLDVATPTCSATPADFKSQGMGACPESTKIGSGEGSTESSGAPFEVGPVSFDVTAFARKDGSIMVFSRSGVYLSGELIRADGRFQRTDPPPNCFVVTESPPCSGGEFVPRSLTISFPPRSRVVMGKRHNLITTPRHCPKSGHWKFFDKHTFADGSYDLFVNHPRCKRGS